MNNYSIIILRMKTCNACKKPSIKIIFNLICAIEDENNEKDNTTFFCLNE